MAFLTRTDPARNIDRFYTVQVTPGLFGGWLIMRAAICGSARATASAQRSNKPRAASAV